LRINEAKSAVAPVWDRKFLGYRVLRTKDGTIKRGIARQALQAMKDRVRDITSRNGGRGLQAVIAQLRRDLPGWHAYFRLIETPTILKDLDSWIRRRLRMLLLKQWHRPHTVYLELRSRGLTAREAAQVAAGYGRWWYSAGSTIHLALPARYFDQLGLPRLAA
jgi:RNA-directed DNA polymerase